MAGDAEDIGGISVSIGASHAKLVSDLAEANRLLEQWSKQTFNTKVGATFGGPQQGGGPQAPAAARQQAAPRPAPPPRQTAYDAPGGGYSVRKPGASGLDTGGYQAAHIVEQLRDAAAKTGQVYNAQTGQIEDATRAVRGQREAIVDVQQTAAQSTAVNIDFGPTQNDAQALLATLKEVVATLKEAAAQPLPKAAAGGSRGGGRKAKTATTSAGGEDGEEEEYGSHFPRIQYTRSAPGVRDAEARRLDVNRSEQKLNEQRVREEAKSARSRTAEATAIRRASRGNEQREREADLQALTAQAVAANKEQERLTGSASGGGFAPPLTDARRSEQAAERERQRVRAEAQRARFASGQSAPPGRPGGPAEGPDAGGQARRRDKYDRAHSDEVARAFAQSSRVRQFEASEAQQERLVASRRAAITGGGQTSRTLTSGLSALFGGTRGTQIEAQAQSAQAARQLAAAERAIRPLDDVLAGLARTWSKTTGEARTFNAEQQLAIRRSGEYRKALGEVDKAIKADASATDRLNRLSSGGNIARNLVAITAGGAAFGLGLKGIDAVAKVAGASLSNFLDVQTGFATANTRVTSVLAKQALTLHGNADAAIAAAAAQAGLSAEATQAITPQLRLSTQIKTGAETQQLASELFRGAAGQGGTPAGLFQGYGGPGGLALPPELGGTRGFTETVARDVSAFQAPAGHDQAADINQGAAFVFDDDTRHVMTALAEQQGNVPMAAVGHALDFDPMELGRQVRRAITGEAAPVQQPRGTVLSQEGQAYLASLGDAAKRGAEALHQDTLAAYRHTDSEEEITNAVQAAALAHDSAGVKMARLDHVVLTLGGAVAATAEDYKTAAEQIAVGQGITDPKAVAAANLIAEQQRQKESAASLDTIRSQQAFAMPSIIGHIFRQQQFASQQQLPTQFALQALAAPNLAVGTGIAESEKGGVAKQLGEAVGLQDQLNTKYEQGKQIIEDTYRPGIFKIGGQAMVQAFNTALTAVQATGKAIASIQTGISNEQAAYQVAQYNFQLQIARRTLSDIGGLTGKNFGAGESYLGGLERQNLALSRQGQLLQFNLSQRQINFQTAVAGFAAPGVTPEERQANIKEAQVEASYAQKQLDIQKQMFGNQVQIVDIGNLRQGAYLAKQIGLLVQDRKVTIDTAAAEQQLMRLQQLQSQNVAQVGTYLSAVDNLVSVAFGNIAQFEAAAGKAMAGIAMSVLAQFNIFLGGVNQYLAAFSRVASSTGNYSRGGIGSGPGGAPDPSSLYASGGVIGLSGPTRIGDNILAGEAGNETLVILSHPRSAGTTGTGGGGSVVVNFNGDISASNAGDLDKITRAVMAAMGRSASTLGLRSVG